MYMLHIKTYVRATWIITIDNERVGEREREPCVSCQQVVCVLFASGLLRHTRCMYMYCICVYVTITVCMCECVSVWVGDTGLGEVSCLHRKLNDCRQPIKQKSVQNIIIAVNT